MNEHPMNQTVFLVIAVLLALGVGFYMGHATGSLSANNMSNMSGGMMMDQTMHEHMHPSAGGEGAGADVHMHDDAATVPVSEAMKMMQ